MEPVEARRGIADRVVALTFDDGPSPWTEPIAEALERHGGRGTFFAIGEVVATDEGRRIVRRLLDWATRSATTPGRTRTSSRGSDETIEGEMRRTSALSRRWPAGPVGYWRAPFFRSDERVRAAVGDLAGREVWFSAMPCDWYIPAEETAAKGARRPGGGRHRRPPRRPPGERAARALPGRRARRRSARSA